MLSTDSARVLSRLASVAAAASDQEVFRNEVLEILRAAVPYDIGVLFPPPPMRGPHGVAARGLEPAGWARFALRWPSVWSALRPGVRRADAALELLSPRALQSLTAALDGQPVSSACCVRLARDAASAVLLLVRHASVFDADDLELLRLAVPVLRLGDERAVGVNEVVGAALTRRELEIFDYLCRGYRNEDIALALGTSRFTVRNQLVRLYRKTGVCTRSELVGRASTLLRRWALTAS